MSESDPRFQPKIGPFPAQGSATGFTIASAERTISATGDDIGRTVRSEFAEFPSYYRLRINRALPLSKYRWLLALSSTQPEYSNHDAGLAGYWKLA